MADIVLTYQTQERTYGSAFCHKPHDNYLFEMIQPDNFSTEAGSNQKIHEPLTVEEQPSDWLLPGFILLLMLLVSLVFRAG